MIRTTSGGHDEQVLLLSNRDRMGLDEYDSQDFRRISWGKTCFYSIAMEWGDIMRKTVGVYNGQYLVLFDRDRMGPGEHDRQGLRRI